MATFKAIVIEKIETGSKASLADFDERNLMDGDVTVRPEWSTLNYKDGLAITGKAPVVRRFPMIPGIDWAGTVEPSANPEWKAGDKVILNGWGLGETHLGAYGEKARVKGNWLVPLPAGMSARDAMAIGTAGYTAMLAVMELERHGVTPMSGPVVVTGASRRCRLSRGCNSSPPWLSGHGFDRPAAGGRLPERLGRSRDHRTQRARRTRKNPGKRALGGRHRYGRLDHARQCALDDALPRGGGGLWTGWRHGFADFGRAVYPAQCFAARHRFRHASDCRSANGVETVGERPRSGKACGHDERDRACRGDRGGPQHRRGPRSRSHRG